MTTVNQMLSEFEAANTQVMGISCDSRFSHKAWSVHLHNLQFPLLSDFWPHGEMSSKYGAFEQDGAPNRVTLAVDRDGIIRFVQMVPRKQQRNEEDFRAAIRSLESKVQAA